MHKGQLSRVEGNVRCHISSRLSLEHFSSPTNIPTHSS